MKCKFVVKDSGDKKLIECSACGRKLTIPLSMPMPVATCTNPSIEGAQCRYAGRHLGKLLACGCAGDQEVFRCRHPENASGKAVRSKPSLRDAEAVKYDGWHCSHCLVRDKPWVNTPFVSKFVPQGIIRVGFLTPGFWLGGAERWMMSLAKRFPADMQLTQVVVRDAGEWAPSIRYSLPSGVEFHDGKQHASKAFADVDVVLSWGIGSLPEIWNKCKAEGVAAKLIDVHHAANTTPYIKMLAEASKAADCVAAVSDACRLQFTPEEWSKVRLIPNGADEDRSESPLTRDEARKAVGIYEDEKVVLYFGRIMPDKNIDQLVNAVRMLDDRYRLIMIGPMKFWEDGTLEKWHKLLPRRLTMFESMDSPATFLRASDCFATASLAEAHPLAVSEAAYSGLPTAMFELPWTTWIVNQIPSERFIYPARKGDARQLSLAIQRACESPDRQTDFPFFREKFSATAMAANWAQLIREVATRK